MRIGALFAVLAGLALNAGAARAPETVLLEEKLKKFG
jgi:hypothetical protein